MNSTDIRFFCSDLDGTIMGDAHGTRQFRTTWEALDKNLRPKLGYNSGRLLEDVLKLIERGVLPEPDYIISGVGTSIYDCNAKHMIKEFAEILEEGWDITRVANTIEQLGLSLHKQPDHYQDDYKSSWYFDEASPEEIEIINSALDEAGLETQVVYSSAHHLDILPKWANKGNALKWLLQNLKIPLNKTLVAGDSGNDSAMFRLKGVKGIVVGNAQPELIALTEAMAVFRAAPHEVCAHAVLRGLQYFQVIDQILGAADPTVEQTQLYETLRTSGDGDIGALTPERADIIRTGYHKAIEALKKTITPLGFSACSLEDNESTGTDENYNSVWARDGALTVIGSLPLLTQDDAIHACQRKTLETLLTHTSPNGQIPANVRITDHRPDYSGVGGIASIDSGLWAIIAFYAYVNKTHDLDFLRKYSRTLQMAMDWLSAHDSNNDALLEIPEAGDWTDLFGRSYNVLYDEVLWYRCNVCYARLLQLQGDEQRAGDYLRWARVIRREILANFWPTTQKGIYQSVSFAEQQFSIGDAR